MSDARYEYIAVQMKGLSPGEAKVTERLNSVAEHGWRLVSTTVGKYGLDLLIFERPLEGAE